MLGRREQRPLNQRYHRIQDRARGQHVARARHLNGIDCAAAGERRHPPKAHLLRCREQAMAPFERGGKRSVPGQSRAVTASEPPEPVIEPR